ncbi:MAG: hypothetical protein ACRC0M_12010 [Legionella sp.]
MQRNQLSRPNTLNGLTSAEIRRTAFAHEWKTAKVNQYTKPDPEEALLTSSMVIIKNTIETQNNCWEIQHTVGLSSHNNGYGRVSLMGSKKLAHHVTMMAAKQLGADWVCPAGFDVSHLCGNNKCVNPFHLAVEDRGYNMSRIGCKGHVTVNDRAQEITVKFCMCTHEPKCWIQTEIEQPIDIQE